MGEKSLIRNTEIFHYTFRYSVLESVEVEECRSPTGDSGGECGRVIPPMVGSKKYLQKNSKKGFLNNSKKGFIGVPK